MIKQTIFAVSMDENRPILTGSLIEFKNGEMTFVSIDGFRLALRKSSVEGTSPDFNVVVPGKTLNEIGKILQHTDEDITIYSTNNQILFDIGKCKIVSRLLEGDYLNYKSIIPKDFETKIKVNTRDILSSIERASLMTMEEKKYPVKFNISDDKIIISSNTDMGAVREELRIEMYFTSSVGPCTIRKIENDNFAYMILPVRIKSE